MAERPRITVMGPNPLVSVSIERRGAAEDIHIHPAGQGVWVSRIAAELGAHPVLCGFMGGETGATLLARLAGSGIECRPVSTAGSSGTYIVDRRGPEREVLAASWAPAPSRHEVDDLVAASCAAALGSAVLVMCNPFPAEGLPEDAYETIATNVRAAGVPLVVDLSTPRLDRVLACEPALVKVNDWELAEYVVGPVEGSRGVEAAQRLLAAGARAVAVTRAEEPVLVAVRECEPYEIVPPRFERGHREGCGDTMTGAVAAGLARGLGLPEALVLGVAAGSANFLRQGLGTGRRAVIEELTGQIVVRPLAAAAA